MYLSDQALMTRWIEHRDAQAFKQLTSKYGGAVYGVCMRILRNSNDAEDVSQQCFIALANIKGRMPDSMGAWLHRIATNQAINHLRSDQRRRAREERFAREMSAVTEAHWDDVSQFIDQAVDELPEKLRTTIVAHFFEDQTVTAIAARENVTHGAISQRLQKGVAIVRESLKRRGISVGVAALAVMLTENAMGAPICSATLIQSFGKIALSGGTLGAKKAPLLGFPANFLAGAAAATILAAVSVFLLPISTARPVDAAIIEKAAAPVATTESSELAIDTSIAVEKPTATARAIVASPPTVPAAVTAKEISDWRKIVDSYANNQDKIRCINFAYTQSSIGDNYHADFGYPGGHREAFERGVMITDGNRCYMEQYRWGDWLTGETTPADRPMLNACVWDGDAMTEYAAAGGNRYGKPGWIQFHRNARQSSVKNSAFRNGSSYLLFSRYGNAAMIGYPIDAGLRMEQILRGASNISLRSAKEPVMNEECYVIDAETAYGIFAVWFDPSHGFNIAQYTLHQRPGDINGKKALASDRAHGYHYTAQAFTEIDGLWVPMESTLRIQRLVNGQIGDDHTQRQVRTAIVLNEGCNDDDAYALPAESISNGAEWKEFGSTGKIAAEYIWHDGMLYTETGEAVQTWPESKQGYGRGRDPLAPTEAGG